MTTGNKRDNRSRFFRRIGLGIAAAGFVLAIVWSLRHQDRPQRVVLADLVQHGAAAGFNVLLITLDTTRPDRLGCYGYERAQTPTIDSLVDHGVRFDDAVTSVPLTLPSHATILTGRYPPSIGVRDNGGYMLAAEHVTLAEILKSNGYDTAAFVSCFVLDRRFGLDQGFDFYDFRISKGGNTGADSLMSERRAHAVTASALQWLETRQGSAPDTPLFMWIHYFDPHHPYDSPLPDAERYRAQPYDAEIAFVDVQLRRLLDAFAEHGLSDRTLTVLVSDHGEALYDHEEAYHGIFLYECTIRAALILSCPELFERSYRVDDRVVGTVDIVPTILDLLGMPASPSVDGLSLLASAAAPDRAIYIETLFPLANACSPLHGLRRHGEKYILAPESEYYNLRADPHEQQNLHTRNPQALPALEAQLAELLNEWLHGSAAGGAVRDMSPQELQRLAALGYVRGADDMDSTTLADPKEQIHVINEMTEVGRLKAQGHLREALELAREVAHNSAGWFAPVCLAAEIHQELGQPEQAVQLLSDFTNEHEQALALHQLARTLFGVRRYDACLAALARAEQQDSRFGAVFMLRGDVLFARHQYAQAMAEYKKAAAVDPDRLAREISEKMQRAAQHLPEAKP